MNTRTVREELAARLKTIDRLRAHAFPQGTITPDAAIVQPQRVDFDKTYGRGMDAGALAVIVATGKPYDRSAHERLDAYAAGSGTRSIKAVLESGAYDSFDEVTVTSVVWDVIPIGGVEYLAALFTLDIAGPGSGG